MRLYELTHADAQEYDRAERTKIHTSNKLPPSNAVKKYTGNSTPINSDLHARHYSPGAGKDSRKTVDSLDSILDKHRVKQNLVVYTGVKQSIQAAYKTYGVPYDQPIRLILPAYTSTSTDFQVSLGFARTFEFDTALNLPINFEEKKNRKFDYASNVIRISLPKGTPGGSVDSQSEFKGEEEILLGRGSVILVQPNPVIVYSKYSPNVVTLIWSATLEK